MSSEQIISSENLVEATRSELTEIDSMAINDHAQRFEELHQSLASALSSIDGL